MILFVIISNNILLNLLIALTYYLVPDSLLIQYTSPSSYCSFEILFTNILFIKTQLFLFGLPKKALQLIKAYKVKQT